MAQEVAKVGAAPPPALPTGIGLIPQNMEQAIRLAEMMSRAKMVPAPLQGSVGDCLMVVEQSMRWNMSPFAVAQCTASVHGKLLFEGKLVAAAVENSGALDGYLDYAFSGEGQTRKITVTGTRKGDKAPRSVEIMLKDAATANDWWKKTPDQMLVYHGARVWARRWTPSVMLGVYSPEEFARGEVPTIEGGAVEITSEPAPETPKRRTTAEALNALEIDLAAAQTANAVDEVIARDETQRLIDFCASRPEAKKRLDEMVAAALARFAEAEEMGT